MYPRRSGVQRGRWRGITLALALVSVLVTTGCGSSGSGGGASSKLGLKSSDTLMIGTSNDAPLSFIVNGNAQGVLPDVLRVVMKQEGLKNLKSVAMPFASIIPSVQSEKIDMVGDGMYVTPERSKQITFTKPSMFNPEGLVVKKGNPQNLHSLQQLHGHTVGTYQGTVWVEWLNDLHKKDSSIKVKLYPTIQGAIDDVGTGRLDAALIDASITGYAVKKNPSLGVEVVSDYQPRDKKGTAIAFGVAKGNDALARAVDRALASMRSDGSLEKILTRWGLTPTSLYLQP
jgi:polar amino acid transport system substrate-binding protein